MMLPTTLEGGLVSVGIPVDPKTKQQGCVESKLSEVWYRQSVRAGEAYMPAMVIVVPVVRVRPRRTTTPPPPFHTPRTSSANELQLRVIML